MSIPISGTLYDPFGNVARFADIKFVTLQGSGDVIESSSAVYRTDENGAYSIDVQLGRYAVYMRFNGNNGAYDKIQTITVNSDVVASTLGELLEYTEPLTPAEILIVQQLAAEAVAAKDDAQAAALQAAIDESLAAASASSAQASATAAANSVALLAPVAVNGGVWAGGQQFTAYNQYMIYSGEAYSPLPATVLPYTVGATPNLGFVYQIALNDHSKLANRNAIGAHDASAINTDSSESVQDYIDGNTKLRDIISSGSVYPVEFSKTVGDGDTVPSGYTHLNTVNGIVRMVPVKTGLISGMTSTRATIGGSLVNLFPYDLPDSQTDAVAVYNAKLQARLQRSANNEIGGSCCILGDSITAGVGATSLTSSYATLVNNSLADYQTGGYGQDNEANFDWVSMGGVALSGQTNGTSGPIQRSKIIAVGGTITVTRPNATKVAFFYDRTTTSGKVQVKQGGVTLATIDCAGTDTKNVLSAYTTVASGGANITFSVIDAPVEFLAIVPIGDNTSQSNVMMSMRMAVSGFNTTHFLADPAQLVSIGTVGAVAGTDSVFVLAIGTNDIYTAARTPYEYTDNLRTIGTTLESYRPRNTIVLVVPPKSNESLHPVAISGLTHLDYKQAIYQLAVEQKWAVIDHSNLELNEQSLLPDGLHPEDRGHQLMAVNVLKSFGIPLKAPLTGVQRDAIAAKSDAVLYRRKADMTTFTGTTTREKTLTSMGVTASDFVVGVYIRWKSTGVMIPYQDCQDLQNGIGLQMLRSFTGANYSVAKLFYKSTANDGTGFASPQGALSGNITNTVSGYNDAEVIVEFLRSSKIDSTL